MKAEQFRIGLATNSSLHAVIAPVVSHMSNDHRKQTLRLLLEPEQSGLALVRYIQLKHGCSEEVAYQRLAAFVKKRIPLADHHNLKRGVAGDRPYRLKQAQSLLRHDPDELEKI